MPNQPRLNEMGNKLIHLDGVVSQFVDTFRRYDGELSGLTCNEAESFASVLEELGGERGHEAATNVLQRHAVFDDEIDDEHHPMFHEQGGVCRYPDTCPVTNHEYDSSDDEIERRKDGS
ncbi:MAG: hypothetical protein ABWY36_05415 [Leifsonia sp.]